jgi:hypothetical protein
MQSTHAQRAAWLAFIAAAVQYERWTLQGPNRVPFTRLTCWAFCIDKPAGRRAFALTWTAFASWFCWHVLRRAST